jgi:nicotinamide-nucleotide amidase
LAKAASRLRTQVGEWIYGEGDQDLAALLLQACRERKLTIGVAESCTGGLLGARLTAVPGSSAVVQGGVIAYANDVKERLLGVTADLLREHGAVSESVVRAMAAGARQAANANIGIGITGIAGPDGGTPAKPVGTVWIGVDIDGEVTARVFAFWGDRDEIRQRSAQWAMEIVRQRLT